MHVNEREAVALGMARLIPNLVREAQLDFFSKQNVTQMQFLVLLAVSSYGTCSMNPLANNFHVTLPTMTGIVDRLVRAGYVRRIESPQDRRRVFLGLTPKGDAFVKGHRRMVQKRWDDVMRVLDEKDVHDFQRIVSKLLKPFDAERTA